MQTFLPSPNYRESAKILDRMRLGKQRVETLQLLNALAGLSKGWVNHPAAKMWRGFEQSLTNYGHCMCDEWIARGYQDSVRGKLPEFVVSCPDPPWLGDPDFHASHRSQLLRKDFEHYSQFHWSEVPGLLPYVWPKGSAVGNPIAMPAIALPVFEDVDDGKDYVRGFDTE